MSFSWAAVAVPYWVALGLLLVVPLAAAQEGAAHGVAQGSARGADVQSERWPEGGPEGVPKVVPATAPAHPATPRAFWLSSGVGSYHLQNADQYNQRNPGLGLEVPFTVPHMPALLGQDLRWAVGFFRNSERATSVYAGAFLFPWSGAEGRVKIGALAGVINGYQRANQGGFFPLMVPTLAFEVQAWGANVFWVPPVAGVPSTLALQVKRAF